MPEFAFGGAHTTGPALANSGKGRCYCIFTARGGYPETDPTGYDR
jgi:hypothetical protein